MESDEGVAPAGGPRHVAVTLAKRSMGYQSWDALLASDRPDKTITNRVRGCGFFWGGGRAGAGGRGWLVACHSSSAAPSLQ